MMFRLVILLICVNALNVFGAAVQVLLPNLQPDMAFDRGLYRFSEFNKGEVVFRNGKFSDVMLNYNIWHDEMHFIDSNGDTLSVANPATIRFINMNGSRFYYDKGWLQIIDTAQGIVLAFRQVLNKSRPAQKTGYETMKPNEVAGPETFFTGNGQKYGLGNNELTVLSATEYYFFGDENSHFTKAKKTFLLAYFKKHKDDISAFVATNHTNFNVLEDLLKVLAFCKKLD
jgi:hypothetical protein